MSLKSIVQEAEQALANGFFKEAEHLYTRAIEVDPSNPNLYESRALCRIQLHQYDDALQDAEMALDLNPDFVMGYFRQGVSLQCLGDFSQSIVSFSEGLVRDQKNPQLLNAIIEVSLNSPIRTSLEPVMSQLRKMRLDTNPFIITSVIGQELLAHSHTEDAVQVLENAVSIGTRSLKLKGSVFSALSSALWSLGDTEKAIHYMNEDLTVSRMLSDSVGECRAHGNLGAAFYSQGNFDVAKENHNRQLALAQTIQDDRAMASAFSSLGHVHTALGDHQLAVESHKQSAAILRNLKDITGWCRQLGLIATAYLTLGDLDSALQWQLECLRVTTDEFDSDSQDGAREEAKARVDLATVYHKMQKYPEEISCLQKSIEISRSIGDKESESQTLSSLGYIARHTGDMQKAQLSYERLLELALSGNNQSMEAKACANLGVIHHQIGDYEMALKLQARNLELSLEFRDLSSQGRAHGNIGNAYSAMGMYEQAIQHHLKELEISSSSKDKSSECTTHGNLAVAYQALNNDEKAFYHYSCQAKLSTDIGDITNESRAYMNLANFHSSRKEYRSAIDIYNKYLFITENNGLDKPAGVAKAFYNVGFAYFSLRDYANAINSYEKSLKISLDIEDMISAARAYCNLGLAWKSYGDTTKALECQNSFLALSNQLQSARGVFKALGNLGDIFVSSKQPVEALKYYQQQYELAQQGDDTLLRAQACAALGSAYRAMGDFQKALELHSEELQIYQQSKDAKSEFRAHGHLGTVLTSLGEFSGASKCYENQCFVAKQMNDLNLQSTALGNIGITSINMQDYEKAIDFFERQLLVVKKMESPNSEKGRVLCNIADCYEALGNYNEAITLFEESLECAVELKQSALFERVYRGLCSAHKLTNNPQEAFKYCQLRIKSCQDLGNVELLAESYGEMGYIFTILADFENALSCLKLQMKYSEKFAHIRGDAACGLGSVYLMLKQYKKSLVFHQLDLQIALDANSVPCQGRAHGNLGAVYEAVHDHLMAIKHQEQHLFIADSLNDPLAKLTALRGIARNVLRLGSNHQRATLLLQQALLLARELGMKEDEGRVILDLALAEYVCGDLSNCQIHLEEAMNILMKEFWNSGVLGNTVNISIHPNQCIDIFEELITCQSAMTCMFIKTNQHSMALESAEKLHKFPEIVAQKRQGKQEIIQPENLTEKLVQYSAKEDSVILYYAINAGNILTWVVTPQEGLCGFMQQPIFFHHHKVNESDENSMSRSSNLLSHLISELRDSLGLESPSVEPEDPSSGENGVHRPSNNVNEEDSSKKDFELGNSKDETFKMYHRLISSQASMHYTENLSSLNLLGQEKSFLSKKPPIFALHELLIGGMQQKIQKYASQEPIKNLILVLEGELVSVPFALLKKRSTESYLSQQFNLRVVTSAADLLAEDFRKGSIVTGQLTRAVVIGNPIINDIVDATQSQASEDEATMVGSLLKIEPLTGKYAIKERVLDNLRSSELFHLACSFSMAPPYGIYLSSVDEKVTKAENVPSDVSNADSGIGRETVGIGQEDVFDLEKPQMTLTSEEIAQRSLTLGDFIKFDLSHVKLAVFGSAHLQDSEIITENGSSFSADSKLIRILTMVRSLLCSGIQTLLLPLWPVPETVCKILTQSFYSRLMSGLPASVALTQSLDLIRMNKQFEHPSYWAGFVLIGRDVTLDPNNLPLFYSLGFLIKSDPGRFHDALKLVLHLIDKSLERMDSGSNTSVPMYAAQASISKKVHNVTGWRELFSAVGFELTQCTSGIPEAVFFPKADIKQDVLNIKSELISYLQLSVPVITGLNRLFLSPSVGYILKDSISNCLDEYTEKRNDSNGYENAPQMTLIIKQNTWRMEGCSEVLSGLGFNISQIGEENVMLHCSTDYHGNIETTSKLLKAFFGNATNENSPENEIQQNTNENRRVVSSQASKKIPLSHIITRGLPPSSRRSIALDFEASFKSQSSLDSSSHLELPDHMTKPTEHEAKSVLQRETNQLQNDVSNLNSEMPKNFTNLPSSERIFAPKPILPHHIPVKLKNQSRGNIDSPDPLAKSPSHQNQTIHSDITIAINLAEDRTINNAQSSSHSIQRSKRFQFHNSGSPKLARPSLEIKVPRSPQKSPMFYRNTDSTTSQGFVTQDFDLRTSQKSNIADNSTESRRNDMTVEEIVANHESNPSTSTNQDIYHLSTNSTENERNLAHFVPILPPDDTNVTFSAPTSIVHPKAKRVFPVKSLEGSRFKGESSNQHSYVPAPSVARGLPVRSNPFEYSHIVDKLTRLSTSDLSESGQDSQGHFKDIGNRDPNNNEKLNLPVSTDTQNTLKSFPTGTIESSIKVSTAAVLHEGRSTYNKVVNYVHSELRKTPQELVQTSPHEGAKATQMGKPIQTLDRLKETSHMYSKSLDSSVSPHKQQEVFHKYSLSQDGPLPPPYKHPEFVTSPRRQIGENIHSRTSSYASHSSVGSNKSSQQKDQENNLKFEKEKLKTPIKRVSSNQSFTGSWGSHVSYQLETGNHGKTWYIHENVSPQQDGSKSSPKESIENHFASGLPVRPIPISGNYTLGQTNHRTVSNQNQPRVDLFQYTRRSKSTQQNHGSVYEDKKSIEHSQQPQQNTRYQEQTSTSHMQTTIIPPQLFMGQHGVAGRLVQTSDMIPTMNVPLQQNIHSQLSSQQVLDQNYHGAYQVNQSPGHQLYHRMKDRNHEDQSRPFVNQKPFQLNQSPTQSYHSDQSFNQFAQEYQSETTQIQQDERRAMPIKTINSGKAMQRNSPLSSYITETHQNHSQQLGTHILGPNQQQFSSQNIPQYGNTYYKPVKPPKPSSLVQTNTRSQENIGNSSQDQQGDNHIAFV
ncbi:uncharacterized protein LOC120344400 [Styela clava]